ncbi:hypothetical protein EVAR_81880_1 [Eumeta japonica]|uniref:Uncharacterized protein n=1 Tax=Eumeta variegata TaxID=151549 RepID=A0A4C1UYF3_EUMVA|nr:hypothetical protein EVAR_81880_1 [Eumeta japonica]
MSSPCGSAVFDEVDETTSSKRPITLISKRNYVTDRTTSYTPMGVTHQTRFGLALSIYQIENPIRRYVKLTIGGQQKSTSRSSSLSAPLRERGFRSTTSGSNTLQVT